MAKLFNPLEYKAHQLKPLETYLNKITPKFKPYFDIISKLKIEKTRTVGCLSCLYQIYDIKPYNTLYDKARNFLEKYFDDPDPKWNYSTNRTEDSVNNENLHGRSPLQIYFLSIQLYQAINDKNISIEDCFHYLIYSITYKTIIGMGGEEFVERYIKEILKYQIQKSSYQMDLSEGIDYIITDNNIKYLIQVKPSSHIYKLDEKNKQDKIIKYDNDAFNKYGIHIYYIFYRYDPNLDDYTLLLNNANNTFFFPLNHIIQINNNNAKCILKPKEIDFINPYHQNTFTIHQPQNFNTSNIANVKNLFHQQYLNFPKTGENK